VPVNPALNLPASSPTVFETVLAVLLIAEPAAVAAFLVEAATLLAVLEPPVTRLPTDFTPFFTKPMLPLAAFPIHFIPNMFSSDSTL